MNESTQDEAGDDFVAFFLAGTNVTGQYRCTGCGYGVTLHAMLPICPMCSGESWEATPWTPFSSMNELRQLRSVSRPASLD